MTRAGTPRLLTPAEAAAVLGVRPETVRWRAEQGKLTAVKTPGGHRRYPESEVRAQPPRRPW